jgi:AcrR family transcriptional regulator
VPETLRELRREQIVRAARRIVAEEGLSALTIAALEARLDFTRGVITYHFRDKDEIVEAVLQSAVAEIDAAMLQGVQAAPGAEEKVRAILEGEVRGFLEHPEAAQVLLSFWGKISSDPRAARLNAALYARYREMSRAFLESAFPGADADAAAAVLVGIVIGIVCQAHFDPKAVDAAAAVDEAARLIARGLRAPRAKLSRRAARARR